MRGSTKLRTWCVLVVALPVALGTLPACSLGEKQELADRVVQARSMDIGPQAVAIGMTIELLKRPGGFELPEGLPGQTTGGEDGPVNLGGGFLEGVMAFDTGRSAVFAPPEAAARITALAGAATADTPVLVVADHDALTVRRPAGQVVAARPWYRLELDRTKDVTKPDAVASLTGRSPGDFAVLTPTLMVELLAGVLPGSVQTKDDGTITGRISFDKAAREDDLSDDERETREHAFRLFAVTDDVQDFEITLGPKGQIESLLYKLEMTPDRVTRFRLSWGMQVTGPGPPIVEPDPGEVVSITSFNQARSAVTDWIPS